MGASTTGSSTPATPPTPATPAELRTSNLLGAASLALSDLLLSGVTAATQTSRSGAAALVVLAGAPGVSVTELGRRIQLSQSAATRMVENLEKQGLVSRKSSWANWVGLHLTELGTRAAQELLGARRQALATAVSTLDEDEQRQLDTLLGKLLAELCHEPGDADRLCRLCDRLACVAQDAVCPVGEADRRLHGPSDGGTTGRDGGTAGTDGAASGQRPAARSGARRPAARGPDSTGRPKGPPHAG
ncbi:MarR family winged helix-turn-helix transcriptional regulator [Streptomyces sp. TS71-3]|uniref:MarR family winged helix-turn-helix transcriptional regulator n=1 Tax=Streptomyces sp. TS71-3 TaxID=2733862 RepID=UPI001AFE0F4F|nr:MarR family transcriptional regulator [Streptomyces sp. TS71-3]GHJ41609.1 hypothetical protein Sm713_72180 [Streptomyces sp. TS71-3]